MQTQNQYLDHVADPSFQGVNRFYMLSHENNAQKRNYKKYFLPTVEIKNYNVMVNQRNFFDQHVI